MRVVSSQWSGVSKSVIALALCAVLFAFCSGARAQSPKKLSQIGYLSSVSRHSDSYRSDAFRQGLHSLGYVEGRNIAIEYRYADGDLSRLPGLVSELIQLKIDVIVASSASGVLAAKKATPSIPIVMTNVGDPVGEGIIDSLARPGGNVTGLTGVAPDLSGKRLELLKETIPRLSRVGVLWDPASRGAATLFKETEAAGVLMKLQLQSLEVRHQEDFESAFKAATARQLSALVVLQGPVTATHRRTIVDFATKSRLPTMFGEGAHVEAGGLMSYAPNYNDLFRRAATYVDKILKGAQARGLAR